MLEGRRVVHRGRNTVFRKASRGFLGIAGRFARLVSLACHDLRTPLATVQGFARRRSSASRTLGEPADRYMEMISPERMQMAELLDALALVARIESGRYEPGLVDADTRELVARRPRLVERARHRCR